MIAKTKVYYELHQFVSGKSSGLVPNEDGIIAFALEFPGMCSKPELQVVLGFTTRGYEEVPAFRMAFNPQEVHSSKRKFDPEVIQIMIRNRKYFQELFTEVEKVSSVERQVKSILETYQVHGFKTPEYERLNGVQSKAKADILLASKQVTEYDINPEKDYSQKNLLPFLGPFPYPRIIALAHITDVWGGRKAGVAFDDSETLDHSFLHRNMMKSVALNSRIHGLDRVSTKYRIEGKEVTCTHGKGDGHLATDHTFTYGEHITRIEVHSGERVDRIQLDFSLPGVGTPVSIAAGPVCIKHKREHRFRPNERAYAFCGRAGKYIDHLAVRYFSF
jgi:hypothetical protein